MSIPSQSIRTIRILDRAGEKIPSQVKLQASSQARQPVQRSGEKKSLGIVLLLAVLEVMQSSPFFFEYLWVNPLL